jgi:hypothetical protein
MPDDDTRPPSLGTPLGSEAGPAQRGSCYREFTRSPAGPLPPTGTRVVWDLINIFRFDDDGRLIEELVRTDYRSFLRQLGAEGR